MTKAMAIDQGKQGIRVNCLRPDDSSFMTGAALVVDGGGIAD